MKAIEKKILMIEKAEVNVEKPNEANEPLQGKEEDKLKNSERDAKPKNELVPIEYFAINLM
jgi:hypothetical protein